MPSYQRDYSWTEETWEDLWEDLTAIDGTGLDHYMGAVVLESQERKHYRVIDGQQRIATLTILIVACVDYLFSLAHSGIDAEQNRERATELERGYLGTKDPASLRVTPKLKLNANDDNFFQLNISQRKKPAGGLRLLSDSERLMWNCFLFFSERIDAKFKSNPNGEDVARFVNETVTEHLIFITVRVPDQLSAYTVFETLNARGLELTETDLLKNYLLSLADKLSQSQMEPLLKQWGRVSNHVGNARFPEFLRHHLNSRRSFVRSNQLYKTIRQEVADLRQVFDLMNQLETDAVWFEALNDENSEFWLDYQNAAEHVRVLNLFKVSQYMPLILAAKEVFKEQELVEILRYCAVVAVRFNGVSRRSTHSLESIYNHAALQIRGGFARTLQAVRNELKSVYIDDHEFEKDFATLKLKAGGISGKRLRYILARIERQISGSDISELGMTATVEHILPENPAVDAWDQFSPESYERCVDRIGNYSLLERKLNGELASNASFDEKKRIYEKSRYTLSKELTECDEWNEATINSRQLGMAKIAKTIWSFTI